VRVWEPLVYWVHLKNYATEIKTQPKGSTTSHRVRIHFMHVSRAIHLLLFHALHLSHPTTHIRPYTTHLNYYPSIKIPAGWKLRGQSSAMTNLSATKVASSSRHAALTFYVFSICRGNEFIPASKVATNSQHIYHIQQFLQGVWSRQSTQLNRPISGCCRRL
jgi:hypothetical protein